MDHWLSFHVGEIVPEGRKGNKARKDAGIKIEKQPRHQGLVSKEEGSHRRRGMDGIQAPGT